MYKDDGKAGTKCLIRADQIQVQSASAKRDGATRKFSHKFRS